MALTPRLELRQSQSLTLTPQLMQSIRLLQLSHLEINAFVEAELLRNPLLEPDDGSAAAEAETEAPERPEAPALEDTVTSGARAGSAESITGTFDTDLENVFPHQGEQDGPGLDGPWRLRGGGDGGDMPDMDQYAAPRPSLVDHVTAQLGLVLHDPAERLIAAFLVDGLDPSGYLGVDPAAVAEQLGTTPAAVEAVLTRLQTCDPAGIFARDLRECLALQLREKDRLDPLMARLLEHLDLLAAHDLPALARTVGVDRDDLDDMLTELRRLDPRPGRAFETGPVAAIVPDVFVRPGPDGSWVVELNADILPRVLVNRTYYASVSRQARGAAEKSFLTDCLATANWLTRSLDQRAQTILKVTTEIVKQQDGFLTHGVTHLRPMTLKMVADAIAMHESTVSRVTANKYVSTPRGPFELKYFFTTGLGSTSGGGEHSAEAVRHRIRQLIETEAPAAILSDDRIAEILGREQGVEVARRTVAKYREGMNIPSSVIRRRQKRALAAAGI